MKTSTPESPKPSSPITVLLMGPPGSFKTTFMLQFPDLHVLDCDLNLDGPEKFIRGSMKLPISYSYEHIPTNDDGTAVAVEDCYDRLISLLNKVPADKKWIGVDGLTAINEYIVRKILAKQRIDAMEARNWSTFKSDAIALLSAKLRQTNRNVIVTAHEVRIEKSNQKDMMAPILVGYEPFIQSKVSEMLGGFFTDMWRISCETAPGDRMEWKLQTTKIPLYDQLKNSRGMPSVIISPTWDSVKKYLQ